MPTTPEFDDYLKLLWSSRSQGVFQAQKQLIGWLFTLHAGGIAGTLGYANARGARCVVVLALAALVTGIVLLLVWGTLMYYFEAGGFRAMKLDVNAVESEKMSMQDFVAAEGRRQSEHRLCEIIAWISGFLSLIGLISLILAIVKT